MVSQLRYDNQIGTLTTETSAINHSNGDPPTSVLKLLQNGMYAIQVISPRTFEPGSFTAAYNKVRGDVALRSAVKQALETRDADEKAVIQLADAVRTYAESVEVSEKHLRGECAGCVHLVPR